MKYYFAVTLGIVLLSTVSFADGKLDRKKELTVARETGTLVEAPVALRLRIVPNGFQLNWTLSPHDPGTVTGYELVRADRLSGPFDPVATVGKGTAEFIDTTALPEIIYYYKVRAVAGKEYSPFSNTVAGER
jgi:hypothetical protein